MRQDAQRVLEQMRLSNGLYVASLSSDYHYVWIRDVCYTAFAHLNEQNAYYDQTYHAMLDIFRRYQWKIDYHVLHRPTETYQYIHPRYSAETFDELNSPWGNAQNDAIGVFLFGLGQGLRRGKEMLRDEAVQTVVQQLIRYLGTLHYWEDEDNGMWEENQELHTSSVGACLAGLLAVKPYFDVHPEWIELGWRTLNTLLPRESASKTCDLALLSLIYPYRLLTGDRAQHIIAEVERELLRDRGVLRYKGDQYYANDHREAEWCMGLPWLGLCHLETGDVDAAARYLHWTEQVMTEPGVLPELYLGGTDQPNPNTPLAWGVSLYMQLYDALVGVGADARDEVPEDTAV